MRGSSQKGGAGPPRSCGAQDPPAPRNLYVAGRDPHLLSVIACELLVDDRQVAFLVGDDDTNLHIFSYSPVRA